MESFDMFLNGNFVALQPFRQRYGVYIEGDGWTIPTKWQSALFQSGQCGAFVGVFLAGPVTNWLGYRWTTICALMLMNATIFVSFFVRKCSMLLGIDAILPTECCIGRLASRSHRWTNPRGYPMGLFHRQCPSLCLRNSTACSTWCMHSFSADELVDWRYHCCCCHLWIPGSQRPVGLAYPSRSAVDLPGKMSSRR